MEKVDDVDDMEKVDPAPRLAPRTQKGRAPARGHFMIIDSGPGHVWLDHPVES